MLFAGLACRVANVVVAVVTEGHIDYAPLAEMLYEAEVVTYGIAIFDAEHYGPLALLL